MADVSDHSHHTTQPRRTHRPPTSRQLRYLRILAEGTGTTFAVPGTSREASLEILRLQRLSSSPLRELLDDHSELATDRERMQLSTAIRAEEISGYGSTATWRTNNE
jgi:hypothetical protein